LPEPSSALPLFYSAPVPLSSSWHGAWRLLPGGAGFAADASAIPLVATDFPGASRSYPILFTQDVISAVALVGLEQHNLFVDGDAWAEGAYVPAYVRRYPFVLIEAVDKGGFQLAIDATSSLVARSGDEGALLFVDGEPSDVTRRALDFCRAFNEDHERVRAFCQALADEALLVDRQANVTLPNGRTLGVGGFQVVDPERFAQLGEETIVDWHRKGWLALVHFHLASLERFQSLLARQAARGGGTPPAPADASDAAPATTSAPSSPSQTEKASS